MNPTITPTAAAEIRRRLEQLFAERTAAALEGLTDSAYSADLESEIAATRHAYVGLAVTEIATLRAELSGALHG